MDRVMFRRAFHPRSIVAGLLAMAALGGLPAALRAETLFFRNDTKVSLVVQGTCVIRGRVFNDRPNLLKPGEKCRITLLGDKLITIRDAKAANRIIHKSKIDGGTVDQYLLIIVDPLMPKQLKLDTTDKKTFLKKP
jgi:hypothetical protein